MMKSSILKILAALGIVIISAQVVIELSFTGDVPITLQTLAVLSVAVFLSTQESATALSLYLILGAVGIPVYAEGASGMDVLLGNSGGYLFGFLIAAVLVSYFKSKNTPYSIAELFTLMLLGTAAILLPGVLYLAYKNNMNLAVQYGLIPFIPGAIIKIALGTIATFFISKFISSRSIEDSPF